MYDSELLRKNNNIYTEHFSVGYNVKQEKPPYMSIVYAAHGAGGFVVDGISGDMREGDVVLVKADTECAFYSTNPEQMRSVYYCAFFQDILPFTLKGLEKDFPMLKYFLSGNHGYLHIHDTPKKEIRGYMVQMIDEFSFLKPCREYTMKSLVTLCMIGILKISAENKERAEESDTSAVVGGVINYVNQHLYSKISVSELADIFHITPQHLCRVFRRQTGVTITDFVNRLRVEHIKDSLKNTARPIYLIYDDFDFTTRYINQIFRRYTGCSMRQYKKSFQDPEKDS